IPFGTGRSTYQTMRPPTEMPPHVSAMKIAANTTGAMPLPLRASPLKRAITARIAATIERTPPRTSPMNSGMGMSKRPASANQNAAQAVGLELRSTEEDMLHYLVSAARAPQLARPASPVTHPWSFGPAIAGRGGPLF